MERLTRIKRNSPQYAHKCAMLGVKGLLIGLCILILTSCVSIKRYERDMNEVIEILRLQTEIIKQLEEKL